jgi:hypothetical protein
VSTDANEEERALDILCCSYIPPEFMESSAPVRCGFILTDPDDNRYITFMAIRDRFANVLHSAACVFKQANGDGYIDGIKLTVRDRLLPADPDMSDDVL